MLASTALTTSVARSAVVGVTGRLIKLHPRPSGSVAVPVLPTVAVAVALPGGAVGVAVGVPSPVPTTKEATATVLAGSSTPSVAGPGPASGGTLSV